MTGTTHVQGSGGTLVVDRATGDVLSREGASVGGDGYPEIEGFDPATLTDPHMDILECGYRTAAGGRVEPDPAFLAHVADVAAGGPGLL